MSSCCGEREDLRGHLSEKKIIPVRKMDSLVGSPRRSLQEVRPALDQIVPELTSIIAMYERGLETVIAAPFSKEEIDRLVRVRRIVTSVFMSYEETGYGFIEFRTGPQEEKIEAHHLGMGRRQDGRMHRWNSLRSSNVNELTTHLSNDISRSGVPQPESEDEGQSFLDIRSVFMLLKWRFETTRVSDPVARAREKTLEFLDEFIDHRAMDSLALEFYTYASAVNMELEVPVSALDGKGDGWMMYERAIREAMKCMC